ncbi:TPA: morphogenetic protein [Serratia liquefaciens]|nr:morphogenetic protein [Serratia liquefaciens]
MKERPVIFNSEMVRAILDGRKTQTRRAISDRHLHLIDVASQVGECYPLESGIDHANSQSYYREHCPFGQIGDRLWVRETFAAFDADWKHPGKPHDLKDGPWPNVVYPASVAKIPDGTCRPSIHMPRWASRITLEITAVRVERLNDISQEDAQAEGMELTGWVPSYSNPDNAGFDETFTPYDNFAMLWESIYGEESWRANPWVWVIEFRRLEAQHG